MNILKPNELKKLKKLKEENEKLKQKIIMLENEIDIMKERYELEEIIHNETIRTLKFINFVASALIIVLGLGYTLWR